MRKAIIILLGALSLLACTRIYTNCPPITQYDQDFNLQLAKELTPLPENSAIIQAMKDYASLRDQLRACQ